MRPRWTRKTDPAQNGASHPFTFRLSIHQVDAMDEAIRRGVAANRTEFVQDAIALALHEQKWEAENASAVGP